MSQQGEKTLDNSGGGYNDGNFSRGTRPQFLIVANLGDQKDHGLVMTSTHRTLSQIANIATIGLAVVFVYWIVFERKVETDVSGEYVGVGQHVPLPVDSKSAGSIKIAIFLDSDCQFCEQSIDDYKMLLELYRNAPNAHLIFLFDYSETDMSGYLASKNIPADIGALVSFEQVRIRATPTVLILDEKDTVKKIYEGKLKANEKLELSKTFDSF
ncbi:MAG: hypothetical protein KF881_04030 [Acidobacteria bacterium]|nr:hypothetical protein [Acidobacteriota bacterium]